MQDRIIILGAGLMQGPAIKIAKELGLFTVVIDGDANALNAGLADQFKKIDLKDKEGIEAFSRSLQKTGGNLGIMTAGTDFSASVAWTAERLGLPGIPYETALNASDKARMRACFQKAGLPSPAFTAITGNALPENFPGKFPLVVKPVDNMGGRGCRSVHLIEEYREAIAEALKFSASGRAIAEEFIEGPEFSVDAIIYKGEITICGLADRHICFPPYFIEMGHTMPAALSGKEQEAVLETFRQGIHALGLADKGNIGAAKGDIKLSPRGPVIGEIAARLSGGYMSGWTYPYASGAVPIKAAILIALGKKPQGLRPLKTWTSAERAFISVPGTVKEITGLEDARNMPFVKDLFLRANAGSKVDFPRNNVSKCGNIISAAPGREAATEAAEKAARSILIRLAPNSPETEAFLSAPLQKAFPPDAFKVNEKIKELLSELPETAILQDDKPENFYIVSFPEFAALGLSDYAGRTLPENLDAIRKLTGLSLPEIHAKNLKYTDNNNKSLLGKSFWKALIRGAYQGAVYYYDCLRRNNETNI